METATEMKKHMTLLLSWFFQGSKVVLFFFMLFVTYRYGHLHLGSPDDKKEFSNLAYFCIIFAAAAGSPLLVYNVQETLMHQESNYFVQAGYRSQDEIDLFAITMSGSNWGITNWTHFTIVGIAMSLAGHRYRLPMTFRSCLYPILGSFTWGWMGDVLDGSTIVLTVLGLVSTLAAAVFHIVRRASLGWMSETSTADEITSIQNAIVWVVTALSTVTVISGFQGTVLHVSLLRMGLFSLLLCLLFFMDDTKFLLNLIVQGVGDHLQVNLFQ
jgi:choline/glycine/proline betaine transport protein